MDLRERPPEVADAGRLLSLVIELWADLARPRPPERYVRPFLGRVLDGHGGRVGEVEGYRLHAALAAREDVSLRDAADEQGDHTVAYVDALDGEAGDTLVVDGIRLDPSHRGGRLDVELAALAAELAGHGCTTLAVRPAPGDAPDWAAAGFAEVGGLMLRRLDVTT